MTSLNVQGVKPQRPLIGHGGKIVAIGNDNLAVCQGRSDDLLHMLPAVGDEKVQLRRRGETLTAMANYPADFLPKKTVGGFPGQDHRQTQVGKMAGQKPGLGGLADAVKTFQGNEPSPV